MDWQLLSQRLDWFAHNNQPCWNELSKNPGIPIDFILAHPEKPWDFRGVSQRPDLIIDHVLAHVDKPWSWYHLTIHPNITARNMFAHRDLPWSWDYIYTKRDVAFGDILDHPNLVRWRAWQVALSKGPDLFKVRSTDLDYVALVRRHLAARRIQRRWREAIANPSYQLCRGRILREFGELGEDGA
jgi:hypothetical protein